MGRETKLFSSKERKTKAEISEFLHKLADKLSTGEIKLKSGVEETNLRLSNYLILEVQVKDEEQGTKGIEHNLKVEVKWFDNDKNEPSSLELS